MEFFGALIWSSMALVITFLVGAVVGERRAWRSAHKRLAEAEAAKELAVAEAWESGGKAACEACNRASRHFGAIMQASFPIFDWNPPADYPGRPKPRSAAGAAVMSQKDIAILRRWGIDGR